MRTGKIIAYVGAAFFIIFGGLFILGAFSPDGQVSWLLVGAVLVGIGFVLIWFATRRLSDAGDANQNVTLKLDLSGDINPEKMTCTSCGGELSMDDIRIVAGAPVVNCPYCNAAYQLTEEPKW
jgi:hypothetical protein